MDHPDEATAQAVEAVARESYGRLVAYLASVTGDLASAEDALGDALVAALRSWPDRGVPDRPDSWLITAARRRIVDSGRRRATADNARVEVARVLEEQVERLGTGAVVDERLRLMFVCAHPAIDEHMRSPLMLQTVLGLDAARIARAFLVPPTTMGQRLVRTKAKIKSARIPFRVPDGAELAPRLQSVLDAIYAAFGTGWDELGQGAGAGEELAEEAIRLARTVVDLLPAEPEAHGLLALLLHVQARTAARQDASGSFVPLSEQDVERWSRPLIVEAEDHLERALAHGRPGPFQLHAAIQSAHNVRAATGSTDWNAVARLYDGLAVLAPTTGTLVARAAAHRTAHGAAAAQRLLAEVPDDRAVGYQPYWVVRTWCELDLGSPAAPASAARALALTTSPGVAEHLRRAFDQALDGA